MNKIGSVKVQSSFKKSGLKVTNRTAPRISQAARKRMAVLERIKQEMAARARHTPIG